MLSCCSLSFPSSQTFSLLFPAIACHPLCLFPLLLKLPCACLTSCTFRESVAYRPGRGTPKPQFISEFSVKASRHSTESWRDLPSRNPASSSDRAEPRRSVLTLCTHGRPHGILQGSSVKYQPAHLGQAMIEAQLLLCCPTSPPDRLFQPVLQRRCLV